MSTAVLISGQMRTARACAAGIKAAFPEADFYVHAVADLEADDAELFDPLRLVIEPQHEMPERREYSWQMGRGCHGVQRVLKQLHGLRRVWQIYQQGAKRHDWIVRCRSDLVFSVAPEQEHERRGTLMVPTFCNYWGFNDRFAIMRPEVAAHYFQRINALDGYIDRGGVFHPESLLRSVVGWADVRRTRAMFDTLRPDGTRDTPQFSAEWGDIFHDPL